ncbi:MAG: DUF4349 domain-containing protein [Chloroflexi bacterium]|nr:DUF4349 domain-containing protein [Chloroflexota bacterium]
MHAKKWGYLGITLALILGMASCAPLLSKSVAVPTPAPPAARGLAEQAATAPKPGISYDAGAIPPSEERMIVSTANLSIVVKDAMAALDNVKEIAVNLGGYISQSNSWYQGEVVRAQVTIRVPAKSLDTALDRIKALATRVEQENISGQDVTEEYTDLQSQLRNLQATENELLELLRTVRERSTKAEDILAVHRELVNIRGQIETLQGRKQYLENMTALATITVDLIPEELEKPVVEPGWDPGRTLRNAARALVNTLKVLANVVIWALVYGVPILLILLVPVLVLWSVWRWWQRRRVAKG